MEKKLQNRYQKLCRDNPQAIVELWTMDEHRLGLKPIPRRIWADKARKFNGRCELEIPVVVVIWLCGSSIWRNLLLDSSLCHQRVVFTSFRRFCPRI